MNSPGKILITGGESMMAGYLADLAGTANCLVLNRKSLDIGDSRALERILSTGQVRAVVNAAGVTKGPRSQVMDANALYPAELARVCRRHNIRFVYLSSARVFDGALDRPYIEADAVSPMDDYGESKAVGERMVEDAVSDGAFYIFRLPMVMGRRLRHPEGQILTRLIINAKEKGLIRVASDVYHSPVYAGDVAAIMVRCIKEEWPSGIYHLSSYEAVCLHALSVQLLTHLRIEAEILPVSATLFDPSGKSPKYQVLGSTKAPFLDGWRTAVDRFVLDVQGAVSVREGSV